MNLILLQGVCKLLSTQLERRILTLMWSLIHYSKMLIPHLFKYYQVYSNFLFIIFILFLNKTGPVDCSQSIVAPASLPNINVGTAPTFSITSYDQYLYFIIRNKRGGIEVGRGKEKSIFILKNIRFSNGMNTNPNSYYRTSFTPSGQGKALLSPSLFYFRDLHLISK